MSVYPTKPFPETLSLQLGELLYQLRAALDGAVYGAAIRDTKQNPPANKENLEFPIRKSKRSFERAIYKIAPLADKRQSIIESVQPYHAEALPIEQRLASEPRAIGILNEWARIDRHRKLHIVGTFASAIQPLLDLPPGVNITHLSPQESYSLESESVVATFELTGWVPHMPLRSNPNLDLSIDVDEQPSRLDDQDTLGPRRNVMIDAVEAVVRRIENSF